MPVQFRCDGCQGKLSISRRKAGCQVECPKCGQPLTVPTGDAVADELTDLLVAAQSAVTADSRPPPRPAPPRPPAKRPVRLEDMPLFERPDFEKLLDPVAYTPAPLPLPLSDDSIPDRSSAAAPGHDPDAIILSRTTATLIVVAVVVLLGLAFAAGFLVGG